MNRKIFRLTFILTSLLSINIFAQDKVEGYVYDDNTKESLPSANIYWSGTTNGTISDQKGKFSINPNSKTDKLVVSFTGYSNDTISVKKGSKNVNVYLKNSATKLSQVTINERQQSTFISKISVDKKEFISAEGLKHLACCNLGESFENSATVDVGYSDAVSGSRQIQLLGLTGVYSQLLLENMPFLRGLSAPFGLGYVPGSWMESISISKGVATVIHGYETTTGQINIEYEKPHNADPFFVNLYMNSETKGEINLKANRQITDRLSTGLLVHGSFLGKENDVHKDGFMDYPKMSQLNFVNRWQYEGKGFHSQSLINYLHESRTGGQLGFKRSQIGDTTIYGLGGDVDRLHFFTKNGFTVGNTGSIGTQITGTYFRNKAFYGINDYLGEQSDIYANFLFDNEARGGHRYTLGASFRYTDAKEDYLGKAIDSNKVIYNTINTNGELIRENFFRKEIVPGVFGQFTFIYGKKFLATAGMRYDYNSHYEQSILTPRLHFRWRLSDDMTLRGSIGKGYRSANILADNFGLLASSRHIIIDKNNPLKMEDAFNGGLNISHCWKTKDEREFTITLDYYHTRFINQVIMDLEQSVHKAVFYNLSDIGGQSYSNSVQLDFLLEPIKSFNLTLAVRYNDVQSTYKDSKTNEYTLMEKPYMSKWKGLVVMSYKTKYDKWIFDLTTQLNGRQRLPNYMGKTDDYSKPYIYMLGQITRKFKSFDIYAGCENITNYTQEHLVMGADRPFSSHFDASVVYAPVMGRLLYVGFRMTIK